MRLMATLVIGMIVGAAVWGTALAAIPDPETGVIQACYKTVTGQLRVVDAASECRNDESPLSWNEAGVPGPPGLSGYELRRQQEYIAPGQHVGVTVLCSEGKRVLGGGYVIETPTDVKVGGTAPWCTDAVCGGNFVTDRWTVLVENVGVVTRQVNVVALCALVPGF